MVIRKAMTGPIHRRGFQRSSLRVTLVAYLIMACIGLAGCKFCVRNNGPVFVQLKYGHAQSCLPRPLCAPRIGLASSDQVSGEVGNRPCGCRQCCDEIPLSMIFVWRLNNSTQAPCGTEASGPSVPADAFFVPDGPSHEFQSPHLCASHQILSSLRSTVLLI